MDKNQQQLLVLLLVLAFLYTVFIVFTNSKMEGLQNTKYPFSPKLSEARRESSYTALTPPQKNDLVPTHMMFGEVYRYTNENFVSYDIYGYLHLINGSVFDKKVEQKYKVYITDDNGQAIIEEELKRDGDDVYKLKLRDIPSNNSTHFNNVIITFIDEKNKESIVLQGMLRKQ